MPLDQQDYQPWTKANPRPLPNKLSALIFLAIEDLERAERSPDHVIQMSTWCRKDIIGKCHVCLAGSVMAFSLGGPFNIGYDAPLWDTPDGKKMFDLNSVRSGDVEDAFDYLTDCQHEIVWLEEDIVEYHTDPTLFKTQLRDLAGRLDTAGY